MQALRSLWPPFPLQLFNDVFVPALLLTTDRNCSEELGWEQAQTQVQARRVWRLITETPMSAN